MIEDTIYPYLEYKEKYMINSRIPKGFKEAVVKMEDALKTAPDDVSVIALDQTNKDLFPFIQIE